MYREARAKKEKEKEKEKKFLGGEGDYILMPSPKNVKIFSRLDPISGSMA